MQNWEGNPYCTEKWLSRNEMWCAADDHNYVCDICAKEFFDSEFHWSSIDKISNFNEMAPN